MKKKLNIIIAGGGTGGHLYSGIAIAEEFKKISSEHNALFVGTEYGLEKTIVPESGFNLRFINVSRLKGSGIKTRLKTLFGLPKAYRQAKKIIKEFEADLIFGIGGYASGPLCIAGALNKIPTAIIEQNAYPGFTNRVLAKFVKKVFIAFSSAARFFKAKKVILSGNPIRGSLHAPSLPKTLQANKFTLFVLGGSQGASSLNTAMLACLNELEQYKDRLIIYHQSGPTDLEKVKSVYESLNFDATVFAFDSDLRPYYQAADLVLCRAGAGTITELMLLGKASLLVPYPYAADNHQYFNAMELVHAKAAELINNQDLETHLLFQRLTYYIENPQVLAMMAEQARSLAKPNAAQQIAQHCLEMIHV